MSFKNPIPHARLAELVADALKERDAALAGEDNEAAGFWGPMHTALLELQEVRASIVIPKDVAERAAHACFYDHQVSKDATAETAGRAMLRAISAFLELRNNPS